jgi:hypothetical protein
MSFEQNASPKSATDAIIGNLEFASLRGSLALLPSIAVAALAREPTCPTK